MVCDDAAQWNLEVLTRESGGVQQRSIGLEFLYYTTTALVLRAVS